jgi:hypothetical protein
MVTLELSHLSFNLESYSHVLFHSLVLLERKFYHVVGSHIRRS